MSRIDIPYLEVLLTQKCNLRCDGCSVYANYSSNYVPSFNELSEFVRLWGQRLSPKQFRILGGEPFLHPKLLDFMQVVYKTFPDADRWVVSNGILVGRQPEFPRIAAETNTKLLISFHSSDPVYLDKLRIGISQIKRWIQDYPSLQILVADSRDFARFYLGLGKNMRPFTHANPQASWQQCLAKTCINIGGGRLWKCPQIMLLKQTLTKFDLQDQPEWRKYLEYDGIGLDATQEELEAFVVRQGELICSMCPALPKQTYAKEVFNTNFDLESDWVAFDGTPINMHEFLGTVEP